MAVWGLIKDSVCKTNCTQKQSINNSNYYHHHPASPQTIRNSSALCRNHTFYFEFFKRNQKDANFLALKTTRQGRTFLHSKKGEVGERCI